MLKDFYTLLNLDRSHNNVFIKKERERDLENNRIGFSLKTYFCSYIYILAYIKCTPNTQRKQLEPLKIVILEIGTTGITGILKIRLKTFGAINKTGPSTKEKSRW